MTERPQMSPYKLISGTDKNIAAFEEQVSAALLEGYDLANDLVVQIKTSSDGTTETLLFQSLIADEALEYDEDDDEIEEDDEDDDEIEEDDEPEEIEVENIEEDDIEEDSKPS